MSGVIEGLIAAGGNILGGVLQNKARKREIDQQYKRNLDLWKIQNEYNHPKNQVQRLQEAGLSPALLYGGSGSGATAGQAGSIDTPDLQPTSYRNPFDSIPEAIATFQDVRIKQAQSDLLSAQRTKLDHDVMLDTARRVGQEISNISSAAEFQEWKDTQQYRKESIMQDAFYKQAQRKLKGLEAEMYRLAQDEMQKMPKLQREILEKRIALIGNSAELQRLVSEQYKMLLDPKNLKDLARGLITEIIRGLFR